MTKHSRPYKKDRPLGRGTSKASKSTERRDAVRILVALVFILMASAAGLETDSGLDSGETQTSSAIVEAPSANQARPSWARLLLEALHRIV